MVNETLIDKISRLIEQAFFDPFKKLNDQQKHRALKLLLSVRDLPVPDALDTSMRG